MSAAPTHDRTASAARSEGLSALFRPRGVAVVGASSSPAKMGSVMARSLESFPGRVVLVNERVPNPAASLYRSVEAGATALDATVDLVVLCVPAPVCADALERAAAAGVRAALVCAGGFAEAGEQGLKHQQALAEVARRHGVRVLGPNTSGFLAPHHGLFATFVPDAHSVPAGRIGVVAASGGINHAIAYMVADAGYGVSVAVGLGNAMDVGTADAVDYLARDPHTHAIALHVESVVDGPRLLDSVRRASAEKPVVALVVGRADVEDFARSHTGALATAWRTTRAVLAQAGAVLVEDERALVDAVGQLSVTRLRPTADPGVALVTAQAGPGLLVLDDLRHHRVRLPRLAPQTQHSLGDLLPPLTYQANPVDTGRPSASFSDVLTTVAADPGVDVVGVYALAEPDSIEFPDVVHAATLGAVPAALAVGGIPTEVARVREKLLDSEVAVHRDPSGLAVAIRAAVTDARHRHQMQAAGASVDLPSHAAETLRAVTTWNEHDAKLLLDGLGITTPRREVCETDKEAADALASLDLPIVVKLLGSEVRHKTEADGVHLDIRTTDQLSHALSRLRAGGARRFLVEELAPTGVDLLLGARRDPVFGPVVLLGLGGTMAEAIADVTLRAAPLFLEEARAMPEDLLGRDLLHGWRGGPTVDPDELARVTCLFGQILVEHPHLDEIEVNPLRLTRLGLIALDAVITTRRSDGTQHP